MARLLAYPATGRIANWRRASVSAAGVVLTITIVNLSNTGKSSDPTWTKSDACR